MGSTSHALDSRQLHLAIVGLGAGLVSCPANPPRAPEPPAVPRLASRVEKLGQFRLSPHAYGRTGDLLLTDDTGATLTFASSADAPGHRPLRGALVDVGMGPEDKPDPLLYWRPGWRDGNGRMHPLIARSVATANDCSAATAGVRLQGVTDGIALDTVICPEGGGKFRVVTRVTGGAGLASDAAIADELNPGTALALIDDEGSEWDGEHRTSFVAFAEQGLAFVLQGEGLRVTRNRPHIAAEVFPSPIVIRYGPQATSSAEPDASAARSDEKGAIAVRTLQILRGDSLDALDRAAGASKEPRQLSVSWQGQSDATIDIQDAAGRVLATGHLSAGSRAFRLPDGFGTLASVRDEMGVPAADALPLSSGETVISAAPATRGAVSFRYTAENGEPLPVHVILRGMGGTPDPLPRAPAGTFAGGRSLYLLRGEAMLWLAPGTYQVTASHGPAYSLAKTKIEVAPHTMVVARDTLRRVVDTRGWASADFHLHSAPSPDAPVSLPARVASLACEGVDFAVPTDHNRITDYVPFIEAAGMGDRLGTLPGTEITTAPPPSWGHFNAFPLPLPQGAPEDSAPPYYDVAPADLLAAARDAGARIVQVNHGRMAPSIGYFDLVHLDPATGGADPNFSANFDAVEAFNGIYLETPEKVREGVRDLVALARRGLHPTATGNSDSHQLLYEEAGYPRTYVHVGDDPGGPGHAALLEALLRGDTSVSSGPFVELTVDGAGIGSHISLAGRRRVRAHVRVSAPSWVPVETIELWRNDEVFFASMATAAADGVRFEADIDVPIAEDTVLLAWASAEEPLPDVIPYPRARGMGFTGLIYVDADGDGLVTVPPRTATADAGVAANAHD